MPARPIYVIWDTQEDRQVCEKTYKFASAPSETVYDSHADAEAAVMRFLDARLAIEENYYRDPITKQPIRDTEGNYESGFIDRFQLEEWGYDPLYIYEIKELPGFLLHEPNLRKRYLAGDPTARIIVDRRASENAAKAARFRELNARKKAEKEAARHLLGVRVPVDRVAAFNDLAILLNVGIDEEFPSAATRENFAYPPDTPREVLESCPQIHQILDLPQAAGAMLFHFQSGPNRAYKSVSPTGETISVRAPTVSAHELYSDKPARKTGRPPTCTCGQCHKCVSRDRNNAYQREYRSRRQRASEAYWAKQDSKPKS